MASINDNFCKMTVIKVPEPIEDDKPIRIYIPTRGRANRQITYDNLTPYLRRYTTLVVDADEAHLYDRDKYDLWVCPPSVTNLPQKRQFIIDNHDIDRYGLDCIQLDDDFRFFQRRTDEPTHHRNATEQDINEGFQYVPYYKHPVGKQWKRVTLAS